MTGRPVKRLAARFLPARYGLRRFARNDEVRSPGATKQPDGQINETCRVLRAKIFRSRRRANQWFNSARLTRRGAIAIVTNVRWDAVDAGAATDECGSSVRRSRVVLTPRCWRKAAWRYPRGDGGKRAVHRGEHEV